MGLSFEVAPGIVGIDTRMTGRAQVTSAYLLTGDEPTLVETGPSNSAPSVIEGLSELGVGPDDLAHIAVTHVHLDHAGGAGTIAARFPGATVWAHERGAPHLADPTRLVISAGQVYGGADRLLEMFGPVEPVPADRIRAVAEGDRVPAGARALQVLYTPGHASHHVALADPYTGAVFTGDALGIHLPDVGVLRPATPPPDIDLELAIASIERIGERARSALLLSHFGPNADVEGLCGTAVDRWTRWAGIVREAMADTDDPDEIARRLGEETADEFGSAADADAARERYETLSSVRVNAAGLVRYWTKRREREAAAGL